MADPSRERSASDVLANKRDATRYRILVQIAERQPAVSQQEIAEAIGVTSQAVSSYLQELIDRGDVEKHGRGRYEVTKEGVDWLISQTDGLRSFVDHVAENVIGQVDVESALATAPIREGDTVSLSMADGYLQATPGSGGSATAVAISHADAGREVAVTDFEGVLDYDLGTVTVIPVPGVRNGGSQRVDVTAVREAAADHDRIAVAGTESAAVARAAAVDADIEFASAEAVTEAATKGLDVLVLSVTGTLSAHTDALREASISYEVLDVTE